VLGSVAHLLPNLEKLNLKDFASYNQTIPAANFWLRVAYGLAYAMLCVVFGAAIFSRRDLK
jgi:hypothetical protein